MTTWYTYICVCGCECPDILDEFRDAYCVDDDTVDFDLNRVVPMPAVIAAGTEVAQIWQKKTGGVREMHSRSKTGATITICHLIS
jgi:hypothetical protein